MAASKPSSPQLGASRARSQRGPSEAVPSAQRAPAALHMPRDFSISLNAYNRGDPDPSSPVAPATAVKQSMRGFEPTYVNIVDYIIRITYRIWEQKDVGYIYDTYADDCEVWGDSGMLAGRDPVLEHTLSQNNAFPDIRIYAEDVIWAGDDEAGFHTSHRSQIVGTNTGHSAWGPPTGRRVQILCIANCVALDNVIFREHVVYDTCEVLSQLGYDPVEAARKAAAAGGDRVLSGDFLAASPVRSADGGRPASRPIPAIGDEGPEEFVRAAAHTIWNRRNLAAMERIYHPSIVSRGTGGRVLSGVGSLQAYALSVLAAFPDLWFSIDDLYWMGNPRDGYSVAFRWSLIGAHRGAGRYGPPTGREVCLWGVNHWGIENGRVAREWMTFNEFGVLMQIHR
jgi:predicted ester cyclase